MQVGAASGEGRYFMSIDEQDAVIGRLIREKKAAERKRTALEEEAHRIATNLHALAQNLDKRLDGIQLQGAGLDSEFLSREAWITRSDLEEVNRIIPLANDYRETIKELRRTAQQLKQAGIE
jgi:hypothetical protein